MAFDKTGTLTEGSFTVTEVAPTEGGAEEILSLAAAAEQNSNHPIAVSLREAAKNVKLPETEDVEELAGFGVLARLDGKRVLVGNARLMEREGIAIAENHFRAGTVVYVAADGTYLGAILISDTVKPDAKDAIRALRESGVRRTVMLTGDRAASAEGIARELDISEYRADLLPADKVTALEKLLKEKKGTLAFVGDGANDAPVLARADVGIAMGALGSDAAIEAADVVLMDDKPSGIATAVRISRRTRRIVWENIWFALGVKLFFLALSVVGWTNMWAATFADVGVAVIAILNAMRAGK